MNNPGQLDGDRKIPIDQKSRRSMRDLLYVMLTNIRRKEGVDPSRYPSVESDIQYDITRTLTGAEITARETADLLLPAILANQTPGQIVATSGWRQKVATLLMPLICLTTTGTLIISSLAYRETAALHDESVRIKENYELIGHAILSHPDIDQRITKDLITLELGRSITRMGLPEFITLPHRMTPEQVEQINSILNK